MAAMSASGAAAAARCGASILTPRRARRLVQLVRAATAAGGDVEVGTAAERETYLEIASRPSRFQESQWGPEDVCVVLLEAMRVQWNHGYPSTPRGYPRTTHGFHEYPAGMQAAAADRILDVLPGNSLLDPFAGGGTSLVVGMSKGRETFGVDVSPLAAFVATHRTWRPAPGAEEETFEWMRATADAALDGLDAAAVASREEESSPTTGLEPETSSESTSEEPPTTKTGAKRGGGVPRAWLAIRRSLRTALESPNGIEAPPPGLGGTTPEGALWFCLSVALQRSQKGRGKKRHKRGYKNQRRKTRAETENAFKSQLATEAELDAAASFRKCVDEYCDRVNELCACVPVGTPPPVIVNGDVRTLPEASGGGQLPAGSIAAALTSPPYPGVYDYLSFARKVRAGSGAALMADGDGSRSPGKDDGSRSPGNGSSSDADSDRHGALRYFATAVPGDRTWPDEWNVGEFGSRRELRRDPRAFKEAWQEDQTRWIDVVANALAPGGRVAIMIGDGANVDTRVSTIDAGVKCGLTHVASVSMALTHETAEGLVWNAARREHLVLLEKPRDR